MRTTSLSTTSLPTTSLPTRSAHSRFRNRIIGIVVLVVGVSTALASTVQAAPTQSPDVGYSLSTTATSVELTLRNGSATVLPDALLIRNDAGKELFRMPLSYRMDYRELPIDARVVGQRITLVPSKDATRGRILPTTAVEPVRMAAAQTVKKGPQTKQERDDQALARFNQQLSLGTSISSLVGLAIGAVVGAIVGCAIGLTAAVIGCLVGVAPAAGLGSVIGLAIGGGGTAIVGAIQYFQTINSPFVAPK